MNMLDFTGLGKNKPNITARFNLPQDKMRIYVHRDWSGFPFNAKDYVLNTFKDLGLKERSDFFIVLPWINGGDMMADFFGYNWEEPWPANSESPSIYTCNGIYFNGMCCTDARLICGAEEFYRRQTKSSEEYINNPPRIKGLEFQIDSESYY